MFNKGVQEVITILYEKQGEKFMKVELQISETYEEESWLFKHLSRQINPEVIEFAKNLDQKETIKGKIDNQVYLVKIGKIQRFYIENRKVLAGNGESDLTTLIYGSIKSLNSCQPILSKFPNQKSSISIPSLISSSPPTA